MRGGSVRAIEFSVRQLLERRSRLVLAVSGGADSAVLLDAVARLRSPRHRIVVASVDHGTGDAATEATARAVAAAAQHGLPAISERLTLERHGEASWRAGRWAFLRHVATAEGAHVVTAHTRDDQIETVVMRLLRGAGARGLAGLLAPSSVERPLLAHGRADILEYATRRRISFIEDPTNTSLAFLRNRVRLQLLPAIRRASPGFEDEILRLSREAADLRVRVDAVVDEFLLTPREGALMVLDGMALSLLPDESLRLILPALVARAGITLDRRGLTRLAAVVHSAPGARGQLSGGYEAVRSRTELSIIRLPRAAAGLLRLSESGETNFGGFRFLAEPEASFQNRKPEGAPNPWRIYIPKTAEPVVRQWHPGDRLTTDLIGGRRRVRRFFAEAGIVGPLRIGWPVVICGDDVIWIPGVKASQDAVRREGTMVHYTCERRRD
jgi:tRNA(Ile)-lysidine synthase